MCSVTGVAGEEVWLFMLGRVVFIGAGGQFHGKLTLPMVLCTCCLSMSAHSLPFDEQKLEAVFRGFTLPFCPYHLNALASEICRPTTNNRRVCEIVTKDSGLTALVLKLANSPAFGLEMGVCSVPEAMNGVGYAPLLGMLQMGLLKLPETDRFSIHYWVNSVYAANVCAELARMLGKVPVEMAYAFGMLYDCGMLLTARRFANYPQVWQAARSRTDKGFTQVEEEMIATNHATVGYYTVRGCTVPRVLAQAVLHHHDYEVFTGAYGLSAESCMLVAMGAIADYITTERSQLVGIDTEWDRALPAVADFLGQSPQGVGDLVEDVQLQLEENERQRESLKPSSAAAQSQG